MTIDKQKLFESAQELVANGGERSLCDDLPFLLQATPQAVLALFAEIEEDAMHMRAFGEVIRSQAEQIDQLKAENEALRGALIGVINHVEGNTECLVRDLVNWGAPKVDANEFYDECGQIKAIAQAALDAAIAKESSHD